MKEFYDNTKLALLEVKKAVGMESSMVTALVPGWSTGPVLVTQESAEKYTQFNAFPPRCSITVYSDCYLHATSALALYSNYFVRVPFYTSVD